MAQAIEKFSKNEMKRFIVLAAKHALIAFILLYYGVNVVVSDKNIPLCRKFWNQLGNEFTDWRKRCYDGKAKITSPCCKAEKEYLEERRLAHRQMCFFEGKHS